MNFPFNSLARKLTFKPLTLGLVITIAVTLAALNLFATRSLAADAAKPAAAGKPALTVALAQPKSSMLTIKLSANGSVAAWHEASVGAEVNGLRVAELHAQVGDRVKRGQLLASFAAESVHADVALARAAVAEAQANAAEAAANADRARAVQGSGAISAQQVNQYLTQEQTGKARVESAKAQLNLQLLRLKNTQLLAPDSGVISTRMVTVGSVVGAGTEMFKLIRQGRLEWRGEVTSAELGRITTGTTVLVTAPSGAQMKGKVRSLAPTVDAATRNGLVYVDLPSAAPSVAANFKPGMYARGEFELGRSGGLTVPLTAVVVRDGFSYVARVGADSRVAQVKVQTGRIVDDQIEIQSGVKPDDKLVVSGGSFLAEGDLVKVVESPAGSEKPAQAASK
ncbi:efflux RND transporter periplasmic adaptor subunit [Rhodoferax sp.]|uniref:efflux RND transporter periplasmic adaptor subunit n=1 Tax=Rhodoferax sp. TaxID=50421 RepID=UPI0025CF2EB2|nr:efflux RND transporter periplasmic adaptor subunit [Rhodoferax sp.]MCM2342476.1 efflux RND transporter periplasmic adaptor subunit [Rhodoferax sp.]